MALRQVSVCKIKLGQIGTGVRVVSLPFLFPLTFYYVLGPVMHKDLALSLTSYGVYLTKKSLMCG